MTSRRLMQPAKACDLGNCVIERGKLFSRFRFCELLFELVDPLLERR
jgi:hypothetical protein